MVPQPIQLGLEQYSAELFASLNRLSFLYPITWCYEDFRHAEALRVVDTRVSPPLTFNSCYPCAIFASEVCVYVSVDLFERKLEGVFTDHTQIR